MALQQMAVVGPRAEAREEKKEKKDWVERVIEGLTIAKGITGIVSDVGTIKGNNLRNQQLEDEQAGVLTSDQLIGAEKDGFQRVAPGTAGSMPYRTRGKDGEMIDTPLMFVAKKETPKSPTRDWIDGMRGGKPGKILFEDGKATDTFEAAPTKETSGGDKTPKTRAVTYKDANGNEVTEIVADEIGAKFGGTPQGGATFQAKVKNLNAAQLQRFDSASMGLQAVSDMTAAYNKGDNTFSVFGDNAFTMASRNFEDALGRMQSGGAINKDEAASFRAMRPRATDTVDVQKSKLAKLTQEMAMRVSNLGFDPAEVLAERAKMPVPSFVDQSPGTANAAAPTDKAPEDMTAEERAAELKRLRGGK